MASSQRIWVGISCLGLSAFVMILTEFAPIALLSQIATAFDQPYERISLAVTLYALAGASCGLIASIFLSAVPRKPLLIVLLLIIAISNFLVTRATNFEWFLVFRVFGAIGHGIFWATVADYAMKLVTSSHAGKASNLVFTGISLASVVGVPLVNLIGYQYSWQWAFLSFTVLGLVLALCLYFILPNVNTQTTAQKMSFSKLKQYPVVLCLMLATGLTAIFQFCSYSFIEPILAQLLGPTQPYWVSLCLLWFGVSGVIANIFAFVWIDRHIVVLTWLAVVFCSLGFLILALCFSYNIGSLAVILVAILSWGVGISMLFMTLQTWVIRQSGQFSSASNALNSAILNYSIAIGSLLGAWLVRNTSLPMVLWASCLLSLLTLACVVLAARLNVKSDSAA